MLQGSKECTYRDTHADKIYSTTLLGDERASVQAVLMKDRGQSRKDSSSPRPPSARLTGRNPEGNISNLENFYFSGRKDSKHSAGVGLMISKQVQKALRGWQPHGERIIEASFTTKNGNINLNIIQIYSPINEAPNEEKEDFYNTLKLVVDNLPGRRNCQGRRRQHWI